MAKYSAEEVLEILNEEDDIIEDGLDEILCEGSDEEFQFEDDDIERDRESDCSDDDTDSNNTEEGALRKCLSLYLCLRMSSKEYNTRDIIIVHLIVHQTLPGQHQ